jgi:hypothetical protein
VGTSSEWECANVSGGNTKRCFGLVKTASFLLPIEKMLQVAAMASSFGLLDYYTKQ